MVGSHLNVDKVAAWCGVIWLVSIMDVCYSWFFSWSVRYAIGSIFVFFATFLLSNVNGLVITKRRRVIFVFMLLLTLFMFFLKFQIIIAPIKYGPMLCVILWRKSTLIKMYIYFRNYIVFYAILSLFVELLVLSGVYQSLPHSIFKAQDYVQENQGTLNYFYGLFCIPIDRGILTFYRAMGPLREGGHFAIYLGYIYFADKFIYNKRNIWIILSGGLTLSPNFPIEVLITEGCFIVKERNYIKGLYTLMAILLFPLVAFFVMPQTIKDEMGRIVLERSLEKNLENAEEDGFFALIEGRTSSWASSTYESFQKKGLITRLKGYKFPEGLVMSDYRCLILIYGYIGFSLILMCIISVSIGFERNTFGAGLFLIALLVILHRAWMFEQLYFVVIMFLIATAKLVEKTSQCPSKEPSCFSTKRMRYLVTE